MDKNNLKTNKELLLEIKQLKEKNSELEKTKFQTNIWLENSPVCTIIIDLDFNLQYMNPHGIDELQMDNVDSFYGKAYPFSFYPDSSKNILFEKLNEVKETGHKLELEVPIEDCKGNTLWYHSTISPVNNKEGKLDHILITSLNTTINKQAKVELEENYERFQLAFNQQFQFMAILSPEGYTMEINDLPLKAQGAKREDYIGKLFWESPAWKDNPEMQEKVKKQFHEASSMQEPLFSEDSFIAKDGTRHTALATYNAIRDSDNNVRHILAQATDISKLKQAEEALLKSEATVRNKLKAITEPEGDIEMLELADIIDVGVLQSIMDDFFKITGMVAAVLDISGKVLVAVGWQDICTKFHRCNPDSLKNCLESDTILTKGVPEGTCRAYRCKNNMWDIVTPIMVGERHVGNVFMGQYFLEGEVPDVELFRKQAKKYGFDEEEYLIALKKVPHLTKETVEIGMQFYSKLARLISTLSFSTLQQSRLLSERKIAEEALLKSEKKYRDLINLAQEGIWVIDKNNATSFVNPSMAKMLGYSSEEMLGKSLFDFMDEKGIQIANENLERRQAGIREQHDFEFICKNDDRIFAALETAPIMDDDGNYDGAIAGIIDITERKEFEEEREKLLYDIGERMKELNCLYSISKVIEKQGSSLELILEESVSIIPLSWQFPEITCAKIVLKEKEYKTDNFIETKWKQATNINVQGEILGEICVCYLEEKPNCDEGPFLKEERILLESLANRFGEVVERKQVNDEILAAEENLKNTFDLSPSIICKANLETGYFVEANQAVTRILGYSVEEFTSTPYMEFIHPDFREQSGAVITHQLDGREVTFFENKYICKDGSLKWMAWQATKADENGIANAIGSNISERKNTEIELKKALDKALESDRLKSAFLANMSHEIRTPMNGILGFIDLLHAPNLSQEKINKYSDIINKSGDRLLVTINDIIDISKIESGQMEVSKREVSINNLLDELHSFHSSEANKNGLSLILKPTLNKDIKIITDEDKLHGILTNLIKNAIKYSEKGTITFGYKLEDKFVQFFVEDTGIGIPKKRLEAVFNRFEKADIEDVSAFEGSGLGLAISKAYVEMLGGEISVKSEIEKGSNFRFTIPYVRPIKNEKQKTVECIDNKLIGVEKLNLLIVEDDMISAELLKTLLEGMFQQITHVQSGIDAIEVCKNRLNIDLVLMDVKMPIMDGHRATQEIRKFNKDLIIIAQTAYAMLEDKGKAIESGCNDYITKPINKKALLEMIIKHIG